MAQPSRNPFAVTREGSCHLLLAFLTHALSTQTVMGPRPGGVEACPSFMLLKNLCSLHELEVLAALRDVGSLYNWVEHHEELVLSKRQRFKAVRAGLYTGVGTA